jgi:hypothetical protein
MPALTVTVRSGRIGAAAIARRRRSAAISASSCEVSGSSSANSSPPTRAKLSAPRITRFAMRPISHSTPSPAVCPSVSFTSLKSSTSISTIEPPVP